MSDVQELERRLTAALERIAAGLAALPEAGRADARQEAEAELARLRETLETERAANAQLEERVIALKERQERLVAALEAEVARLRGALEQQEAMIQKVKRVNQRLRDNNRALREAGRGQEGDQALLDSALHAELEALRACRESDRAELDAVLGELAPLIRRLEGGADA